MTGIKGPESTASGLAPARRGDETVGYTVKKGDTLDQIAQASGVSVRELLALNPQFDATKADGKLLRTGKGQGRDPDLIAPGEIVQIPARPRAAAAPSRVESTPSLPQTPSATDRVVTEPKPGPAKIAEEPTGATKGIAPELIAKKPEAAPAQATPAPTPTATAAEPREAAKVDAREQPGHAGEAQDTVKKVFNVLGGLFDNPIFNGALAIACAIPGIGQIASAAAAIVSLVTMLGNWMVLDRPPDAAELGRAALFLGGTFLPGLGAFGGLVGMVYGPSSAATAAGRTAKAKESANPSAVKPKADQKPSVAQTLEAVGAQGSLEQLRANKERVASFIKDVEWLRTEYQRLVALELEGGGVQGDDRTNLASLRQYFEVDLPTEVLQQATSAAYDVKLSAPTPKPEHGNLYVVGAPQTLAQVLGQAYAGREQPTDLSAIVRAYNNMPPDSEIQPGQVVYIPTGAQVERARGQRLPALVSWQNAADGAEIRALLAKVMPMLTGVDKAPAQQARAVFEVLKAMPPEPRPMPVAGEAGPERSVSAPLQ